MEENATYNDKLREMQKYVPFLTNIFNALIKQPRDDHQNLYFEKIQVLLDLLTKENKRVNFQTLLRSEKALKNLYDKYEKPVKKLVSKGNEVAKVHSVKECDIVKRERTEKDDSNVNIGELEDKEKPLFSRKEEINYEEKESAEKNGKTLQSNESSQSSEETIIQSNCQSREVETFVKVSSEKRNNEKQNDENISSTNVQSHLPSDISDDEHFTETENQGDVLSDISDNDFGRKSPAKQRSRASSCETIYYNSEHTSVSTSSNSREIRCEYNGEATSSYKYNSERGRVSYHNRHEKEKKSYSKDEKWIERSSKSEGNDLKALEKLREKIAKKLSNVDSGKITLNLGQPKHEKRKKESKNRHRSIESFLSPGPVSASEILEEINGVSSSQNSRDLPFNRKANSSKEITSKSNTKHHRAEFGPKKLTTSHELTTRVVKLVDVDTGKIDSDSIPNSLCLSPKSSQNTKKSLVVEITRNEESFYEDIGDSESDSDVSNLETEKNVPKVSKNDLQMSTQTDVINNNSIPDVRPIVEGKPNDNSLRNASDNKFSEYVVKQLVKDSGDNICTATNPPNIIKKSSREVDKKDNIQSPDIPTVKNSTSSSEHHPTDSSHKVSEINILDIDIDQICKTLSNQGRQMTGLQSSPIIILDDECDEMDVDSTQHIATPLTQNKFEDTIVFDKDLDESIKDNLKMIAINDTISNEPQKLNKTSACKDSSSDVNSKLVSQSKCSTEDITDEENKTEILFYRRPRPQQVPTENLFLRRHQLNRLTKPEMNASNQTVTNQSYMRENILPKESVLKTSTQPIKKRLDPRLMERKISLQSKVPEVDSNDQIPERALPPSMKLSNNVVEKQNPGLIKSDIAKNIICHTDMQSNQIADKLVKEHLTSNSKDPRTKGLVTNNITSLTMQNKNSSNLAIKSNMACEKSIREKIIENLLDDTSSKKCMPSSNNQTDKQKFLLESVNNRTESESNDLSCTKTALVTPTNVSKNAVANKYQTTAQPVHGLLSIVEAKNLNNNVELCDDSLIDISETDIDTICEIISDKNLQKSTESKQTNSTKHSTSNNNVIVKIYNNLPQNKELVSSTVVREDLNTKKMSNLISTDTSCDVQRTEKCKNLPDKTQKSSVGSPVRSVKAERFGESAQLKRQANGEQCKPILTKPSTEKSKLTPTVKLPSNKKKLQLTSENSSLDVEDMANELIRALGMDEDEETSQIAHKRNTEIKRSQMTLQEGPQKKLEVGKSKTEGPASSTEKKKMPNVSHKTNAMIAKKDEVVINDKRDNSLNTNSKPHKNAQEKKHTAKSIDPEISKRNDKKTNEKSSSEKLPSGSDKKEQKYSKEKRETLTDRKISNFKENTHKSNKSDEKQPKSKDNQNSQKRPRSADDKKDKDVIKKKSAKITTHNEKMEQTLKDTKNEKSGSYKEIRKEKVMEMKQNQQKPTEKNMVEKISRINEQSCQNSKASKIKQNSSAKKTEKVTTANTGKFDRNEETLIMANITKKSESNESKESNTKIKNKKPSLTSSSGKSLDKVKETVKINKIINDTGLRDKMPSISTEIRAEIAQAVDECLANVLENEEKVTSNITEASLSDANNKNKLQSVTNIQKSLQTGSRELLSLSKDLRDSFICKDLENLGSRRISSINAERRLKKSLWGMETVEHNLRSQSLKRKLKPTNLEILAPVAKKQRLDNIETLSSEHPTLAKFKIQEVKVVLQRLTIEEDAESSTAKKPKLMENPDSGTLSTNDEILNPPNLCLLEPTKEIPIIDRLQESLPPLSKKKKLIRNVDRNYHSQCEDNDVCKLCHTHFLDSTNLVNHYVNKHRFVEVFISRLPEEDINLLLSRPPLATVEGDRFRGECVFCKNLIVHRKSAWIEHIFSHTGEYFYECSTCKNRAIRISDIEHLVKCQSDQNVSKIFSYDFDVDEILLYGCKVCNYVQYSMDKMLDHISRHHKRARSMQNCNNLVVMKFPKPEPIQSKSPEAEPTMEEEGEIIFQVQTCPLEKLIVKCEDYSDLSEEHSLEVDPLDLGPLDQSETMRSSETNNESKTVIQKNCESATVKGVRLNISNDNENDIFENLIEPITMTKSSKHSKTSNTMISTSTLRTNYATNCLDEKMIISAECLSDPKPPLVLVPGQPINTNQTKVDFGNVLPEKYSINKVVNLGYSLPKASQQLFYCFVRGCRFKFTKELDDLQTHVVKMHNDIVITGPCSVCESSIHFSTWPATLIDEVNHIRQYHSMSRPPNQHTSNNAFTSDIVGASRNNCTQPTNFPMISSGLKNNKNEEIIPTKVNDTIVLSDDEDDEKEKRGLELEINKTIKDSQEAQNSVTFKHVLEVLKPWIHRTRSQKPLDLCIPLLQVEHLKRLFKCMGDNCIFSTDSFRSMLEHCDRHKCYYEAHASRSNALMYKSWLECAYCDFFNRDAQKFVRHVMDAHKRVGFQCGECFYRAQSMPEVLQHQRSIHKNKIKFRIIRLKMETVTPRPCTLLTR